jgi:hypothetical protein
MSNNIGKLKTALSQLTTSIRAETEVRRKLFPNLAQEPLGEYRFESRDDVIASYMHAALDIDADLQKIASAARRMPKPFGDMFCYVAYCDIHQRMKLYQQLIDELVESSAGATEELCQKAVLV